MDADTVRAINELASKFGVTKWELFFFGCVVIVLMQSKDFLTYSLEKHKVTKHHELEAKKLQHKVDRETARRKQKKERKSK